MKSKILILLLSCILQLNVNARSYEVSQLPIVVRNIPEWSKDYPTVINDWNGMFVQSVNGELPPVLAVITNINGIKTEGMSEESFNDILASQSQSILEYLVKEEGCNIRKVCTIQYYKSLYWPEGITLNTPDEFPENISMKNIKNASAFSFNTFAFSTGNITEINEDAIMEAAGKALKGLGFKKLEDINKADMVLELTKSRDQYNGYKITLSIKDGTSQNKSVERVLWSIDITDLNGNLKNQENSIKTALNKYCANFPFDIPIYSQSIYGLGVGFESKESVCSGNVVKVLKNSDAYDKGLRSGDAIIEAYAGGSFGVFVTKSRRCYFKPNKGNRQKNWGVDMFLWILPIIPQFTYNNSETYLTDDRSGELTSNHFRVMNSHGQTFTVYAPFVKRTFNFKYIR